MILNGKGKDFWNNFAWFIFALTNSTNKSGLYAAIFIVALFLLVFFWPVLRSPNSIPLGGSPDALKNYYTPWYHAKFDTSYVWFNGMNYPFGEHVTYTDCQPLVANSIRFISVNITDISDYTIGIVNLLMLFSFFPYRDFAVGDSAKIRNGLALCGDCSRRYNDAGATSVSFVWSFRAQLHFCDSVDLVFMALPLW